eukprot:1160353-Pelagomonas_calceolata.AAC.6
MTLHIHQPLLRPFCTDEVHSHEVHNAPVRLANSISKLHATSLFASVNHMANNRLQLAQQRVLAVTCTTSAVLPLAQLIHSYAIDLPNPQGA